MDEESFDILAYDFWFTVVTTDDDGIVVVVPGDIRLGKTNHLASQTYGESHLDTTISRSHLELRRHHRRFVAAEIQIVQLPVNANQWPESNIFLF